MNIAQALAHALPGVPVYEALPAPLPRTAYVVISEITDGRDRQFYPDADGHAPQARTLTLLLTLYGEEGWTLAPLRRLYRSLRGVGDLVREHPELPPLSGVARGAELPPQAADGVSRRPWAATRLQLAYIE